MVLVSPGRVGGFQRGQLSCSVSALCQVWAQAGHTREDYLDGQWSGYFFVGAGDWFLHLALSWTSVDQASLEVGNPPASASPVLGQRCVPP